MEIKLSIIAIIVNEKIRDFENTSLIIYRLSLQLLFDLFASHNSLHII
jgi:hypothetical protein